MPITVEDGLNLGVKNTNRKDPMLYFPQITEIFVSIDYFYLQFKVLHNNEYLNT